MSGLHAQDEETAVPVQLGNELLNSMQVQAATNEMEAALQAIEATTPVSADAAPQVGNFYSAQFSRQRRRMPPLPADILGLNVWSLGDGMFLLDDRNVDYATLSDDDTPMSFFSATFTTNDLWLEITGETNTTAYLVIHPPWNVTNGVYDLQYCTNLASPIQWQWVLRTDPGQTNLVVNNAVDVQGFYRLGLPNDLVANDSLGTNFWIAFMNMDDDDYAHLSLYISSPVGAIGTVVASGVIVNDSTMIATNCGDTALNGLYVLTNLTTQEQMDWTASGLLDAYGASYVNGTNWVNYSGGYWYMVAYDSSTGEITPLYYKPDSSNLNGSSDDWQNDADPASPAPTTICAQVPFSRSFSVAAGAVTNVVLDQNVMILANDVIGTNGIHITTTGQPVSVYALNYDEAGTAAFTCYPTPLLGTNYCLMARPALLSGDDSEFAIVATSSNTTVTITPSANAHLTGWRWTNSFMLQPGQTYQITSAVETNDVTGTLIKSDEPIAVFAGATLAYVPDASTRSGNPLVQEQLPVELWGANALSIGFAGRLNGDRYRILAAYSNTVVTIATTNGTFMTNLTAGTFCDTNLDGPVEFQATQPIQIAQFANGWEFDHPDTQEGDPNEILLPPTGHYLQTNIVYTPYYLTPSGYPGFDENFLNLIVPQSAISNTAVNGSIVAATNFVAIGTSGYFVERKFL